MRLFRRLRRTGRDFARSAAGNVAIIFAVTLPLTLGAGALVAEYGHALVVSAKTQRVADLAAYAGALALASTSSEDSMRLAGRHVATLNGLAATDVTLALVASPRDGTKQAVKASVSLQKTLFLAPVLGVGTTLAINSEAFAQVAGGTASCILALAAGGTGVTMSGGTHITASNCAVSSNSTVSVPCGTTITAKQLAYNSAAAPSQPCGGISGPITKAATADPFAGHAGIAAARARFATIAGQSAPAEPTFAAIGPPPEGKSIEFGWNESSTKAQAIALGCTAAKTGSTWVFTCPGAVTYNIKNLSLGGGLNLDFNVSAVAAYTFSGDVSTTSTTRFGPGAYLFGGNLTTNWGTTSFGAGSYRIRGNLTTNGVTTFGDASISVMGNVATNGTTTFGSGPFSVNGTLSVTGTTKVDENGSGGSYTFIKGINTGGGSTTIFGAGTFQMGRSTNNCSGVYYSICNTSTLTFKGPSVFALSSGLYNSGGARLTLGEGSANSYWIGPASSGDALTVAGGSQTFMADATTGAGVYQFLGNVNASAGGGSCLVIGAAPQHDIRGNFNGAGGVVLGAGVYTIDGYFALGANGGGSSNCAGESVAVKAENVNLVISGKTTFPYGDCGGKAFCATAGYSNIRLTAPTSGALANIAVIGPDANSNGATFTGGASTGKISGAFYFPNGPITMNGGAGVSGGTNCLQLVGSQISMAGGTVLASECVVAGASGGGSVSLVQ